MAVTAHTDDPALRLQAVEWSRLLGLAGSDTAAAPSGLLLAVTPNGLELREQGVAAARVRVQFEHGRHADRRSVHGAALLRRAVGHTRGGLRVWDLTAGLGADAFVLAAAGCTVLAVERCGVMAALLCDGLQRAARGGPELAAAAGRIRLLWGDARWLLPPGPQSSAGSLHGFSPIWLWPNREETAVSAGEGAAEPRPEVVYLDPMFPPKRKTAMSNKYMRLCREVAGPDPDAAELLALSRRVALRRVVVKRSSRAAPLADRPAFAYRGRTVRFDVYLPDDD